MLTIGIALIVFVGAFTVAWFAANVLCYLAIDAQGRFPLGLLTSMAYYSCGVGGTLVALIAGMATLALVTAKLLGAPIP